MRAFPLVLALIVSVIPAAAAAKKVHTAPVPVTRCGPPRAGNDIAFEHCLGNLQMERNTDSLIEQQARQNDLMSQQLIFDQQLRMNNMIELQQPIPRVR